MRRLFKKEVTTEKSNTSQKEEPKNEEIMFTLGDHAKFTIEKNSIKVSNGMAKIDFNLDVDDNWYVYSDKHSKGDSEIMIGKPFKVDLKIQDALGEYQDIDGEILETKVSPENITIIQRTLIQSETKEIDVKIFQPKTKFSVTANDERIKEDSKILMIIDGAMCGKEEKEVNGSMNQGEICIPINKSIPLN